MLKVQQINACSSFGEMNGRKRCQRFCLQLKSTARYRSYSSRQTMLFVASPNL